jgi:hypothetical protein
MHAGNKDAVLDRDARGQDTRRVNTIYHFLSDYPLILITPASVAASRKMEREQASAAEKGQPKNAHTTASNTTVATTLPFTPSRHRKSHYRHTSQQPPSARRVLSRYVTTLPRSLDNFVDVFLHFLVREAHVAASHRKVTLLKVAPTILLRKRPFERDIACCCFCIDERSAHSEFMSFVLPPCVFHLCLKSGVSKTFIIWNDFTLSPRYAHQ